MVFAQLAGVQPGSDVTVPTGQGDALEAQVGAGQVLAGVDRGPVLRPVAGGVLRRGRMVVYLAERGGVIAGAGQELGQERLPWMGHAAVGAHPGGAGVAPGEDAGPRGHAQGVVAVAPLKGESAGRQGIDGWRRADGRAVRAQRIRPLLVGDDQQKVGPICGLWVHRFSKAPSQPSPVAGEGEERALLAQHLPGADARMVMSFHGHLPVDDHIVDARRVETLQPLGIGVGGAQGDGLLVEHGQVGPHSGTDHAAIGDADALHGQGGHLAHRFLDGHQLFLAHKLSQDARKEADKAGISRLQPVAQVQRRAALGRIKEAGVDAGKDTVLPRRGAKVIVFDIVVDQAGTAALFGKGQVEQRVLGIDAALGGDGGDRLALQAAVVGAIPEDHAVPGAAKGDPSRPEPPQWVPGMDRAHGVLDLGARPGRLECLDQLLGAIVIDLEKAARRRAAVWKGLAVYGHVHATQASLLQQVHFHHIVAQDGVLALHVRHLAPRARGLGDLDEFLCGLDVGFPLPADVRGVQPVVAGDDLGQFDQFVRVRIAAGDKDQPAGHAKCALLDGLVEEGLHGLDLGIGSLARVVAHHALAKLVVPGELHVIHPQLFPVQRAQVIVHGPRALRVPGGHAGLRVEAAQIALQEQLAGPALHRRRRAATVAGDGQRAALDQQVEAGGMVKGRPVRVPVDVHPAGGDAQARAVDRARRLGALQVADGLDLGPAHAHVRRVRRGAQPVDDRAALEQQIKHCVFSFVYLRM